jgi:multidrug efflux system membrane fusion protein
MAPPCGPRRGHPKPLIAPFLAVLLAASFVAGCGGKPVARNARVPVTVAKVAVRSMPISIQATGTVEPIQTAAVGSQVGGVIARVTFREGQEVSAGQVLFELDPRPFRAALGAAQGQLAKDRAQAEAAVLDAQRAEKLREQQVIAPADYEQKAAAAGSALGLVETDSAAVANARLNLQYASIRAPIPGRTGKLMVHAGDYVKAASSDPLVTINQMRPIRVAFTVPQSNLPMIQRYSHGDPMVYATPGAGDSVEIAGRFVFVDNAVDPGSGTLLLKGEFPNADTKLWPGAFVQVRLVLATERNAIVVPSPAVANGQQGTYVYVLNPDSTTTSRPITVERGDDVTTVVASGLKPGETVITDGQFRIGPGAKVVVRNAKAESKP